MTNEEAKFILEKNMSAYDIRLNCAYDAAIEALEKQIPKRLQSRSAGSCYCGNCHSMFSHQMYGLDLNYCPWCGQMISWIEEE